jgi:hypothetical protein
MSPNYGHTRIAWSEQIVNDNFAFITLQKPSMDMVTDNHAATSLYHDNDAAQIVNKREREHPFEVFEGRHR